MIFSSPLFIFLFLPVVLLVYFLSNKKIKNLILLIASIFFYAWGEGVYTLIIITSIIMNYFFGILIEYYKKEKNKAKIFLILAIIANLSLIGFFKYFNFIVENINFLLEFVNIAGLEVSRIHLPIGISFFTFQAMSYIIDVFRRKTVAQKNIFNVALYIALFPQLIAGPIVRYHDIAKQINNRFTDLDSFALGIKRFIFGLGKKVLIANLMGSVVDKIFAIPGSEITLSLAWLGIICYTIQIFFDFCTKKHFQTLLNRFPIDFRGVENLGFCVQFS